MGALLVLAAGSVDAGAESERPLHFLSKQCNEDALEMHLDPGPFQDRAGPGHSLALVEGKARVVIVVQDCSQYWIDGEDLGPAQDLHVWVSIRGAEEVRPVVGAERTQPTRTWLGLFYGSSNPRVRQARRAAGAAPAQVEGVFLAPPGPQRAGRVSVQGGLEYSWDVATPAAPSARLVGLNHDVHARNAAGDFVLNRIQALVRVAAGPSQGTMKIAGGEDPPGWIQPGIYPVWVSTFFPMWSRATLGLAPSR